MWTKSGVDPDQLASLDKKPVDLGLAWYKFNNNNNNKLIIAMVVSWEGRFGFDVQANFQSNENDKANWYCFKMVYEAIFSFFNVFDWEINLLFAL